MKKTTILLIILTISMTNCKSNKSTIYNFDDIQDYEFIEIHDEFNMILTEFHENTHYCYSEGGAPFSILIGNTQKSSIPENLTVLSYCDDRVFKIGDLLTITPTGKSGKAERGMFYLAIETIIDGVKKVKYFGSENKVVWGTPNIAE